MTAIECGAKDGDAYLQLSKLFSDKRQYMEALAICQQGMNMSGMPQLFATLLGIDAKA